MLSTAAQYLYARIVQLNNEGKYIPLWGTCLGFEWILSATVQNHSVLDTGFDSENYSIPVKFTRSGLQSQLFSHAPKAIMESLSTLNITFNSHKSGITVYDFAKNIELSSLFDILTVNKDRKGNSFVSSIESRKYPIYATMWHPEKNIYE
jgi:gamma-glutamyl hydrolase